MSDARREAVVRFVIFYVFLVDVEAAAAVLKAHMVQINALVL